MFKVDLHKLHAIISLGKLDLLPKEIVVYFMIRVLVFYVMKLLIINIMYREMKICIHLKGIRDTLQIVIKPYKSEHFRIICHHLDSYCKNRLKYTINQFIIEYK